MGRLGGNCQASRVKVAAWGNMAKKTKN